MTAIDEIKARWAKATPGPWRTVDTGTLHKGHVAVEENSPGGIETIAHVYCGAYEGHGRTNAEAIAAAPSDVATLLAALDTEKARADAACACVDCAVAGGAHHSADAGCGSCAACARDLSRLLSETRAALDAATARAERAEAEIERWQGASGLVGGGRGGYEGDPGEVTPENLARWDWPGKLDALEADRDALRADLDRVERERDDARRARVDANVRTAEAMRDMADLRADLERVERERDRLSAVVHRVICDDFADTEERYAALKTALAGEGGSDGDR